MREQPIESARHATRLAIAMGVLQWAVLLGVSADVAYAGDRFRCIPADGSPTYTSPGSCQSTDAREPLTEQEMADAEAIQERGRPFTRCTAADGSYSVIAFNDKECPSPTDTRSTGYAKQAIKRERVVRSPPETEIAQLPPIGMASSEPPTQRPLTSPSTAVAPSLSVTQERSGSGIYTKLAVFVLLALVIWRIFKWLSQRSEKASAAEREAREERARAAARRRSNPAADQVRRPDAPTAGSIDMQQKAQDLLAALGTGADVPGGMACRSALQQSKLDYSLDSLDRVDVLLDQVRTRFSPQRESWKNQNGAENFCLVLAFYMGEVLARQTTLPIKWHTREQAAVLMPPDIALPDADWSRAVGIIGTVVCVPLGLIEDKLFSGSGEMTCRSYVERLASKLPGAFAQDENQRCAQMLEAFFNDAEIPGGLAYRVQLKDAQLDYSLASLLRLDQMLQFIRPEIKCTYEQFVNATETQNFLRWVGFYIGMTMARVAVTTVKWFDFAQAKQIVPELEFQFETTSMCLLGGRTYFPLGRVTDILLQTNRQCSVYEWAKEALALAPPPIPSILQSSALDDGASSLEAQVDVAIRKAGFVAAWCMFMVEGGTMGAPTVYVPGEGGGGTFTDFSFFDSAESAMAAAKGIMDTNSSQVPFQVMSSDGYANLPTGRTDALTIELRIYANAKSSAQGAFSMMVACPYRNASDPKGFAIYSPKLIECTAPATMHRAIFKHFYLGISEFKVKEFDWFSYLDERI